WDPLSPAAAVALVPECPRGSRSQRPAVEKGEVSQERRADRSSIPVQESSSGAKRQTPTEPCMSVSLEGQSGSGATQRVKTRLSSARMPRVLRADRPGAQDPEDNTTRESGAQKSRSGRIRDGKA
ncbi:hypothetical protein P7K49_034333, partial [Saguinus oedipus]